jgi:hypothetical protein
VKVKELTELLAGCNADEEVYFSMWEGCCGDSRELTLEYADSMDLASTPESRQGIKRIAPRLEF